MFTFFVGSLENVVADFVAEVVKTFEKLEESKLSGVRYATECRDSIASH